MKNNILEKYHIEFDIENVNISVVMTKGFFNLNSEPSVHNHANYEVHFVMEGSARLETEEGDFELDCLEGCILPPDLIHNGISRDEHGIKASFSFDYRRNKRKGNVDLYEIFEKSFGLLTGAVKFKNGEKYVNLIREILSAFYSGARSSESVLKCLFGVLIMYMSESEELSGSENNTSIQRIKSFESGTLMRAVMKEYITCNSRPSLRELAEIVHLSERQTARVFEKEFGMGFKEYVSSNRLRSAKYYLSRTEISINEIPALLGFGSYNGFYKLFRSKTGMNPEKYRENHKIKGLSL